MSWDEEEDTQIYKVVINHEEQYSIWPSDRDNPNGWNDAGKEGTKKECLDHIEEVWTDMRPLSLRKQMEEAAAKAADAPPEPAAAPEPPGESLVQKLAKGDHPIIFRATGDNATTELKQCIDRDYVHVKFTETQGGTELGFKLDGDHSDLSQADFDNGTGRARLAGNLTLDYVKVRCVADLDLASMAGTGRLEILDDAAVN